MIESKDAITILLSTTAICLSLYQLWDKRRKTINIYYSESIRFVSDELKYFVKFTIINPSSSKIHISDTKFYTYLKPKHAFFYRAIIKHTYFGTTVGHLFSEAISQDETKVIEIEATEIFRDFTLIKIAPIVALKIVLVDVEGKKYSKKIKLALLKKKDGFHREENVFSYPDCCFKVDLKNRVRKRKPKNNDILAN